MKAKEFQLFQRHWKQLNCKAIIFSTNYTESDGTSTVFYFLILLKATTDNNQ